MKRHNYVTVYMLQMVYVGGALADEIYLFSNLDSARDSGEGQLTFPKYESYVITKKPLWD